MKFLFFTFKRLVRKKKAPLNSPLEYRAQPGAPPPHCAQKRHANGGPGLRSTLVFRPTPIYHAVRALVANCPARHADDLGVLLTLHPEVEEDQVSFRKGEAAGTHTAVIKDVLIQQRVQVEYRDIQASGGF